MKRKKKYLIPIILLLLLVTSCAKKGIDANEMAPLFVDHFIYGEDKEAFEENFIEGDLLSKQLTLMTDTFEVTFSDVFDSIVGQLSEEEKEKISTDLMKKVRKESSYTYKVKEIEKNKVEVTYDIKGFDYASLVEQTLGTIFVKLMKEESTTTPEQMKESLLTSFEEALVGGKAVSEEVSVKLIFEKEKNQWQIFDNQDEELEQMLLSFIAGVNDKEQYESQMGEMLERVVQKATAE